VTCWGCRRGTRPPPRPPLPSRPGCTDRGRGQGSDPGALTDRLGWFSFFSRGMPGHQRGSQPIVMPLFLSKGGGRAKNINHILIWKFLSAFFGPFPVTCHQYWSPEAKPEAPRPVKPPPGSCGTVPLSIAMIRTPPPAGERQDAVRPASAQVPAPPRPPAAAPPARNPFSVVGSIFSLRLFAVIFVWGDLDGF